MYPLRFQQTSRLRDVEVNGVAALELDQAAEAVARVQVLSRTNGDVDRVGDAGHRLWISRRDRILQPHRLYRLDRLRHLDRVAHVVLPVRLNAEVHVRPQFLAHDLHRAPDAPQVLQRQPSRVAVVARLPVFWVCPRGNPVTLELESGPAELLRLRLSHLRAPGLGIFGALHCRHRAVEADPVAKPSAQEVTRRRFEDSPREVPQRDLDPAGCGYGHPGDCAGPRALHQHLRVELVHIQGILTYDDRPQLVHDQVLDPPAPIRLADTVETGVRFDLDQVPIPGPAHDHALDISDFHLPLLLRRQPVKWHEAQGRSPRDRLQKSTPVHGTSPFGRLIQAVLSRPRRESKRSFGAFS